MSDAVIHTAIVKQLSKQSMKVGRDRAHTLIQGKKSYVQVREIEVDVYFAAFLAAFLGDAFFAAGFLGFFGEALVFLGLAAGFAAGLAAGFLAGFFATASLAAFFAVPFLAAFLGEAALGFLEGDLGFFVLGFLGDFGFLGPSP